MSPTVRVNPAFSRLGRLRELSTGIMKRMGETLMRIRTKA
jgi:hypothetical protein